jgi:adenosylcobinamide-GDP ribazoletransferase
MMPRDQFLRDVIADLRMAASFVTILPVALSKPAADGAVARATWALPVAGLLVGLAGALVYKVASLLGLSPNLAALLALAATALVTGALHEDGLADTADGLGGGRTRERKLEIMRDSRIGTYGLCALILSFGLRWSALATIANPWAVALALCAAHTAARAGLPAFMSQVAPARPDGLSASAGSPPGRSVAIAFAGARAWAGQGAGEPDPARPLRPDAGATCHPPDRRADRRHPWRVRADRRDPDPAGCRSCPDRRLT